MSPTRLDRQRLQRLIGALDERYPPGRDSGRVEIVRAPGRVNLMGDHTDYNEGFVLPVAIDLDVWLAFRRRRDGHVSIGSLQHEEAASFWIDDLEAGRGGGVDAAGEPGDARHWSDFVAGTAWSLREGAMPIRGFDGVVDSIIPMGAGLGSAAALELAAAMAMIGEGRIVPPPALAAIAQRAEREYVGFDGGIVEQFACAAGHLGRALLLDCRSLESRYVALPYGLRVVVCDTGEPRKPRTAVFRDRRAECARAVALLSERMPGLCSLRDLDVASLRRHRALLADNVARRVEHVIAENARVLAVCLAMDRSDLDELGRLFAESHVSLRDQYDVGSPALDAMVQVARGVPGVVASRATGDGLGGCTVNLVLADAVPALKVAVSRDYKRRTGLEGAVYPVDVVEGAGSLATGA